MLKGIARNVGELGFKVSAAGVVCALGLIPASIILNNAALGLAWAAGCPALIAGGIGIMAIEGKILGMMRKKIQAKAEWARKHRHLQAE